MLSTILFSIVTPDCRLTQAQQCCTILLTILNNVGSKTLFNAVFNSPEQVLRFFAVIIGSNTLCIHGKKRTSCSGLMKTAFNNVLPMHIVQSCQQLLFSIVDPELARNQV